MVKLLIPLLLFFLPVWSSAQELEEILEYQSDIEVLTNGSLSVKETITVRSLQREIRRGIFRSFPVIYRDKYNNRVRVGFEVTEVTKDGKPEPYEVLKEGDFRVVRIGNPDVFLNSGIHTYTISYTTNRQIGYFEDFDELYWNVIGDNWSFPIQQASARVRLPEGANIIQYAAYSGPAGNTYCDCELSQEGERTLFVKLTKPLNPREALTVAVAWPKDIVSQPTVVERRLQFFGDNAGVLFGGVAVIIVLAYYLYAWGRVGRDPKKGGIYPQFEAPENLDAPAIRYLYKMRFDHTAFTVAIIRLATKGVIRILEGKSGKYTLELLKEEDESLDAYEVSVVKALFPSSKVIQLDQKEHKKIGAALKTVQRHLKVNYYGKYFRLNSGWLAIGMLFSLLAVIVTLVATFPVRFEDEKIILIIGTLVVLFISAIIADFLFKVHLAFQDGSVKIWTLVGQATSIVVLLAIPALLVSQLDLRLEYTILGVFFVLGLVNFMFLHLIKAPTPAGRLVMDEIEGFRMYLNAAEKPYIQQLNPPGLTPEVFEKYLPYAIALGVGETWGKAFENTLKTTDIDTGRSHAYSPSWYAGRAFKVGAIGAFSQGLSRTFGTVLNASASPPGSSSGSGGGGRSGGGGGGGGGGGW